jgi:hypothetical protein
MRSSLLGYVGILTAVATSAAACSDHPGGGSESTATAASPLTTGNALLSKSSQTTRRATRAPIAIDPAGAQALLKKGAYARDNRMSERAKGDLQRQVLRSVPYYASSYALDGTTYPYTMVGGVPQRGGTTVVSTAMLPVSLVFDEFADASGNSIVMDATPNIQPVLTGPDFQPFGYTSGNTQFADAVQRAQYWSVMGRNWHTLLDQPRMMNPLVIEVPVGASQLYQNTDGVYFTLLDADFFNSQINTIAQLADFRWNELAIMLTPGVFLYEGGDPNNCCILGFHTAWDALNPEGIVDSGPETRAQTFAWASWIDPGLFGTDFADITGLSHEISEWSSDPFVNNATENWAFPLSGGQQCQNNLETGDPVEVTPNPGFPVTLHGYTYHPQTEAMLEWFTRQTPSSAIDGAYSYPDETVLTGPSTDCLIGVDAGSD